jgi:acetyltransferase
MSTYHLQSVFRPQSVAVIGGSPRERSAGRAVMRNCAAPASPARWRGSTRGMPNRWHPHGQAAEGPGLGAGPGGDHRAAIVPQVVRTAAERACRRRSILTAHLGEGPGSLSAQVEAVARKHGLRILGPHCLGVIAPHARLNASIAAHFRRPATLR